MSLRVRRLTQTALFAVAALALSYLELLLPTVLLPLPGAKLGLANLVTAFLVFRDRRQAFAVLMLRLVLNALLFGGAVSLAFSASGGVLSFIVMALCSRLLGERMSYLGLCCAGGVFHNIGQLCAAAVIFGSRAALAYATPLMLSGVVCGAVIGILLNLFSERIGEALAKAIG